MVMAGRSHAKTVQVLRRALDKGARRVFPCRCAVTGRRFYVVCERAPGAEKFAVAAIEREGGARESTLAAAVSAESKQEYRAREFVMSEWECGWCRSAAGFTDCTGCGETVCGGRLVPLNDGGMLFRCHESCGMVGYVAPSPYLYGHDGDGRRRALPKRGWLGIGGDKA